MSGGALEAAAFERRYRADPDPWGYDTRDYERVKYEHTLAAIPTGPIASALELGCSNGAFTERLAGRCDRLLAADFSLEAVRLARERLSASGPGGVTIEQRDLRRDLPAGPFDLIVCSEVLYYWDRDDVIGFCAAAATRLRPGGTVVAVNWLGEDPDAPLDGVAVRELLSERFVGTLDHVRSESGLGYLLDVWRLPGA